MSPPKRRDEASYQSAHRLLGARSGMTVHLTLDEAPTRLRGEVEIELLRIAMEAVTNAR